MIGFFDELPRWREAWIVTGTAVLLSFCFTAPLYLLIFGFDDHFWGIMILAIMVPWAVGIPLSWYMANQRVRLASTARRLQATEEELREANIMLAHKANYDGMTGLPNREHFFDRSEEVRAASANSIFLMLDVDNFKQINDSFGHPQGDEALVLLARSFRKILRKGDLIGRIGGEEFGVLLPDTSEVEGQIIGELIRHEVEHIKFEPHPGIRYVITISIGLTNAASHQQRSLLMRNADAALFEAKRRGRNRVVMFEPGMRTRRRPSPEILHNDIGADLTAISR
ncbi:MAG: GGDEF domain-containing protein [Parasphingorhabdus sp.]